MADMNEKAIEAAAKAAFNAARAWAGEDDPTSFADGKIREVYTDMVRAAINAYTSALPPLRAREEIARTIAPVIAGLDLRNVERARAAANEAAGAVLALSRPAGQEWRDISSDCHGLDNERQVFFYEQDFYVLSNFSAFNLQWRGKTFPTAEHAYHYEKFPVHGGWMHRAEILKAPSAHEAFKYAERERRWRRDDWDHLKVGVMLEILRAKADQHEYVRRKLLATGERELIENSWRDDFWGWGPNRDGKNMLGKLWMEIRTELRADPAPPVAEPIVAEKRTP